MVAHSRPLGSWRGRSSFDWRGPCGVPVCLAAPISGLEASSDCVGVVAEGAQDGVVAVVGGERHALDELGDLVYVELPDVGRTLGAGERFGSVESVKTVSDLYAPASGEVAEVNTALADHPELINSAPYGEGWMIALRLSDPSELDNLMDAEAYEQSIGQAH